MVGIIPARYKGKKLVEGYSFESNKKTIDVPSHYKISIDGVEIDGSVNQQTIVLDAENEGLLTKLNDLTIYQKVNFIVDIVYFRGQVSKIVALDITDTEDEKVNLSNIFKKYTQEG